MPHVITVTFLDPKGRVRSGWKVAGFIAIYMGLLFLVFSALHHLGLDHGLGGEGARAVWVSAGLGAAATWICLAAERRPFTSIGLVPGRRWLLEFLAGSAIGFLLMIVTALIVHGSGGFHWVRNPAIGAHQLLAAAWLYLAVAFNEEILSRGYAFQRLVQGIGPWGGQIIFALLFAYLHWGNPGMHGSTKAWATLNIGLAALLLGLAWIRTGSLALPIGIHLGWNWTQGSLLGFGVSGTTGTPGLWSPVFHGRPEWLTGGAFGLEASLPCALVCGAAILALALWKGTAPKEVAD